MHGGIAVLFRGHAGYLQLPPRVLGAFSPLVPIRVLPVYFALSSALVSALLAWFVFHYCEGWIVSRPVRLALASFVVLMPALGAENTANITNTIWVFAMVAPWALISPREARRDVVVRSIVAIAAATSTALCALFLPLALGFALYRKTRAAWIVAGAFCAGLVLQVGVALHTGRDSSEPSIFRHVASVQYLFGHPAASLLARFTGDRVFVMFLAAGRGISTTGWAGDGTLIVASTICVAAILAVLLRGAARKAQLLALAFVVYAVIWFVAPVWYQGLGLSEGFRYTVVPVMLLASAVAILVAPAGPERTRPIATFGRPVFVAFVVVSIAVGFSVTNIRSQGPDWSTSLTRTYEAHCVGDSPSKEVAVPTREPQPGAIFVAQEYQVVLPCRDFR